MTPKLVLVGGNYWVKKLMFLDSVLGYFAIVALQKKIPFDKILEMLIRQPAMQSQMVFQMTEKWLDVIRGFLYIFGIITFFWGGA